MSEIQVTPETIYEVMSKLETINGKYKEGVDAFNRVKENTYYQSERAAKSMGTYEAASVVVGNLDDKFALVAGSIGYALEEFIKKDEEWGMEFAKLYYNINV
ncbi:MULTISPECIES: hypothetical protein [Staphylococcaceae]|uniref:hypothetical protein n=1 Tax=Staphylococcaceae TaxID=90964 RepID=UPI001CCEAF6F|nr:MULTISPECIES: hypothetical protein [Macrococcus]UBH14519.1 hypothetical protein LAU44_06965 [Macrococcus armenti]UBH16880.1 hypothetical protein LAU39_06990 [Macrococcus armenti]UBH19142.1 hypothetical protein LAU40_06970 [Macrococcus armenti]UTH01520.1 hypothetical protein KFV05_07265 [Macrococcus canis]